LDEAIAAGGIQDLWNSGHNKSGLGQGNNMKFDMYAFASAK
jgi:hypothetical protein